MDLVTNGDFFASLTINVGVSHGSSLGPICFVVCFNGPL